MATLPYKATLANHKLNMKQRFNKDLQTNGLHWIMVYFSKWPKGTDLQVHSPPHTQSCIFSVSFSISFSTHFTFLLRSLIHAHSHTILLCTGAVSLIWKGTIGRVILHGYHSQHHLQVLHHWDWFQHLASCKPCLHLTNIWSTYSWLRNDHWLINTNKSIHFQI